MLDPTHFWPVSHLVEFGKMVEYALYVEHFTLNNLFHEKHNDSLAGQSTATGLIQLVDMWLEAAENTEISAVLLIDHNILLQKLKVYNFHDYLIQWF